MSAIKTKKDMKTAKDILEETFDKHEHRMADYPWHQNEEATIAAMKAYADYKHSFLSHVSDWISVDVQSPVNDMNRDIVVRLKDGEIAHAFYDLDRFYQNGNHDYRGNSFNPEVVEWKYI